MWARVRNEIVVWTGSLPFYFNGVTGFDKLSDSDLLAYEFYRVIEPEIPEYDKATKKLSYSAYYLSGTIVTRDIAVVALTADELELKDMANEATTSEVKAFTLAQIDTYIDNNVTTLAGARVALKKLVRYLIAVFKTKGLI